MNYSAMTSPTHLAALLCSRLCHDLLSPVGAINNGIELLADESDPDMRRNCLDLLEKSARASAAKLQFFRLAFGAAGGFGENIGAGEARQLLEAMVAGDDRLELQWALDDESLAKPVVKILLNLAAIGLAALPRGGTLAIGAESGSQGTEIVIRAAGPRIAFDPAVGQALNGELPETELSSQTAPAHLLNLLIQDLGGALQFVVDGDALVLGAALPAAVVPA